MFDLASESWLDIPSFSGYSVSDKGRFRRKTLSGYRELRGREDRLGYQSVGLVRDGKQIWYLAHRVIAAVFLNAEQLSAPAGKFLTVNHKDRNKTNNHIENLELVTVAQNHKHWRRNGLGAMFDEKVVSEAGLENKVAVKANGEGSAGAGYRVTVPVASAEAMNEVLQPEGV